MPSTTKADPGPAPDFALSPLVAIWELTQACDLACVHCRAEARPWRDPRELTTWEGFRLIEAVRGFGSPILVLSGGDPLKRPDVHDLLRHARDVGLRVAVTPSGTPLLDERAVGDLREAGADLLALSLDGSTAEVHDRFRQVPGSYEATRRALEEARRLGFPLQVNTTVSCHNASDLSAIAVLARRLGAVLWSVFFLVPTGRGRHGQALSPWEQERVFHLLYDLSRALGLEIKTTAAPPYRRVVLQRQALEREAAAAATAAGLPEVPPRGGRTGAGVNDGNGFLFVSHTGEVCPSGFLPLSAGNVRDRNVVEIYRDSDLFRALRDPDRLKGRCGRCEFREVCGGARSRAYARTGDVHAADPYCAYAPPAGS
ncbi:MAG: TIGR04053 family radical SAM/SPASM domain-containing protein [Planctomycetes bacterium]|nr:TIGR04053 family radical SAM/SPASM domain-containing protein [Planctomycetota bacterium]